MEKLMDPDKIMDGLSKELSSALKAMSKAKDVNEKEVHSRIHCCPVNYSMKSDRYIIATGPTCNFGKNFTSIKSSIAIMLT